MPTTLEYAPYLFGIITVSGTTIYKLWRDRRALQRAEFIRTYAWPPGLLGKITVIHPYFRRKEGALIAQGLRQFFLAYLESGRKSVAMPSQAADDLWHEFILYTRAYNDFCRQAFGEFLHHTPARMMKPELKNSNEGLRRVWWQCCKQESINPQNPSRLPLLFALDKKLNIPGGFIYAPDCKDLRRKGVTGTQCATDFSSSSVDGSTDGFGTGSAGSDGSSSDGDGDGGGGCGGGD